MPFNMTVVLILLGGWLLGRGFARVGLPAVIGMVACGIVIGTFCGEMLPPVLFQIEPFLKSFALVVILLRAGLGIRKQTLARVGLTAILMTCVPCLIEGIALTVLFHWLFAFDWAVAGLTGFMLAAVSPAVIVPSMLRLKDQGLGKKNDVPTIILAGASADDVLAITVFTLFLQSATTGSGIVLSRALMAFPLSLILGIVPGILLGAFLVYFFRRRYTDIRATEKALILLMIAVLMVQVGDWLHAAALLGVMTVGFILLEYEEKVANELALKLSKVWVIAEIVLFVLIGISVDLRVAWDAGLKGLLVITLGLVFRSLGVWFATAWSKLSFQERLFCMIAYIPKATVQAALGGVALAHGIEQGETILALAVLSIVFTAPLGLIGIKLGSKRLLADNSFG